MIEGTLHARILSAADERRREVILASLPKVEPTYPELGLDHKHVRAPRYVKDLNDLEAHPELFRCPTCWMILDGPE